MLRISEQVLSAFAKPYALAQAQRLFGALQADSRQGRLRPRSDLVDDDVWKAIQYAADLGFDCFGDAQVFCRLVLDMDGALFRSDLGPPLTEYLWHGRFDGAERMEAARHLMGDDLIGRYFADLGRPAT